MASRSDPYRNFRFLVSIVDPSGGGREPQKPLGRFSEAIYRDGDDPGSPTRKIPASHKVGDVTLKRGLVGSSELSAWITQTRTAGDLAQRDVTITRRDEAGNAIVSWKLSNFVPVRFAGVTLEGKGGGDVAIEELVLSAERIEIESAS